jgi:hypothetical protein
MWKWVKWPNFPEKWAFHYVGTKFHSKVGQKINGQNDRLTRSESHNLGWMDRQSVHFEMECHISKLSQHTVCSMNASFGSKCSVIGVWRDGSSRHREREFGIQKFVSGGCVEHTGEYNSEMVKTVMRFRYIRTFHNYEICTISLAVLSEMSKMTVDRSGSYFSNSNPWSTINYILATERNFI